jgi:hypothetical protein
MIGSSESWEHQQHPHPWHSCAGGGAVHSIISGHRFDVYSLPELTIGWGVASKGKESVVQCPNEPNIIVAITSTETRKGEVGVSKFIPSHLICLFFDEPFFA